MWDLNLFCLCLSLHCEQFCCWFESKLNWTVCECYLVWNCNLRIVPFFWILFSLLLSSCSLCLFVCTFCPNNNRLFRISFVALLFCWKRIVYSFTPTQAWGCAAFQKAISGTVLKLTLWSFLVSFLDCFTEFFVVLTINKMSKNQQFYKSRIQISKDYFSSSNFYFHRFQVLFEFVVNSNPVLSRKKRGKKLCSQKT